MQLLHVGAIVLLAGLAHFDGVGANFNAVDARQVGGSSVPSACKDVCEPVSLFLYDEVSVYLVCFVSRII